MAEQERDETLQHLCYNLELKVARFMRHEADSDAIDADRNAIHARVAELVAKAHEREVEGPWRAAFDDHTDIWWSEGPLDFIRCDDASEARAIANVRNAHHARRQAKEAGK